MKISKKRLRQIIREERAKLSAEAETGNLNEATKGAPSIGFAGWGPNRTPDFAKAYGKDARVIGQYQNNNNDIMEQPMPASGDPKEAAFQKLKYNGAWKDLQEIMHDCSTKIDTWQQEHEVGLEDADMVDVGVQLEEARLALEDLRQLANQVR